MIEIKDLSFSHGKRPILHHLNLTLQRGKLYVLLGPNGSGKTTLLSCMTRLFDIPSGHIFIDNKDVNQFSPKLLAQQISIVLQRSDILFDFSVEDIVAMGRHPYHSRMQADTDEDRSAVENALRLTDTLHLRHRNVNQLSGGEYQRVMIARAIAQSCPHMLLDEPVSNLDIRHQLDVLHILQTLKQEQNTCILVVLHDPNLTLQFADYVYLFKEGQICAAGEPAEVLNTQNLRDIFQIEATVETTASGRSYIVSER